MIESVFYNVGIYCRLSLDDGYSDLNFDRPAFKQLLLDIEAGKINMIITKDLSRLGRYYLQTDYGVKGEEYDNVIFTITKGWYNYQFEVYAPMILNGIQKGKESSYIRNRNLFYVCCSRAKRRLFIFVSLKVDFQFEQFLKYISENQYYTYSDFIKKYKNQNNY